MFWQLLQRIFNNIFGSGMHLPQCVSLRVTSRTMDLRLTITWCVRFRTLCARQQPSTSTAPFFLLQSCSSSPSAGLDPSHLVPASRVISPSMRSLKPLGYLSY
ncbi:uncharacterized protein LOC113383137 [Ctenocephalides felis]|uniref:uncharacterized protein LOC113383137 n=1 Tax=Ctenocephalides felis TaxID=7515 RepID=UPI000E6E1D80|nr:uncharacterized protein LOC113383137 [Ctenocephalides felis]